MLVFRVVFEYLQVRSSNSRAKYSCMSANAIACQFANRSSCNKGVRMHRQRRFRQPAVIGSPSPAHMQHMRMQVPCGAPAAMYVLSSATY